MIRISHEAARGCGYRRGGAIYMVADGPATNCGRLPLPLGACPTCGHGIKPARGWTWIDGDAILAAAPPCRGSIDWNASLAELAKGRNTDACLTCPMGDMAPGRVGLLWVGSRYYPTTQQFLAEATRMGVSRRVSQVPREFVVGTTVVWLAHRQAIATSCTKAQYHVLVKDAEGNARCCHCDRAATECWLPGVFSAFRPTRLEYVVRGNESEEELEAIRARGIETVAVVREGEQLLLGQGGAS